MNLPAFKSVRRAGVPLCAIETPEPAETIQECIRLLTKKDESTIVAWDIIRGIVGLNKLGEQWVNDACPGGPIETGNPSEALMTLYMKGAKAAQPVKRIICFFQNAHRVIDNEAVSQAVWNLRDAFKRQSSCLVLLAPTITLPSSLKHDVVVISEPLPETLELEKVLAGVEADAEIKAPDQDRAIIVDTMRGLSLFAAEQALAMSLTPKGDGIDKDALWDRKRRMIEQTPGLAVWRGGESFADLGGLANLKDFLTRVLTSGKTPVRAIGFIDEIEKGLAGSGGDTSGTSQDQLQVFLKVMQDLDIPGIILVGPPGTGKSAISKAAGNVAGCPVVAIDTGAMKASLVGESEGRIRTAMEVFKAVSQGKGMFIATCNKIASLPPELRRRFTLGTFFVDLPNEEEQAMIWKVWAKRYGITLSDLPACKGWTGAEIRACCDVSFRTGLTLSEASKFIVPVIKSAGDQIESLRKLATGRFISANYPGVYEINRNNIDTEGRKFDN